MKKPKPKPTAQETLEDLAELAGRLNIPDDHLDGELEDAAESDMRLTLKRLQEAVWLDKLEYLYERGYQLGRLRELIQGDTNG
jgi:hypothetical protein